MKRLLPASAGLFAALVMLSPSLVEARERGGPHAQGARGAYHHEMQPERVHPSPLHAHKGQFAPEDVTKILNWAGTRRDRMEESAWGDPSSLPPGLERQLRERGHLPPGLAMKALPPRLSERLGPAPKGYDRVIIGRDIAMVELATGTIADIIRHVF